MGLSCPQPLCQAHEKAGFHVEVSSLLLEKLRYSRPVCQQLWPSARAGRRDTATDVPGPSHRRGRQRWPGQGQTEGQRAWAASHWRHVHVCTRAHTRLSLLWAFPAPLVSAPSPLCLSLSTPLPLLPPHPSLLPLLPLFSLGLMKAPGKGRDCVKCPQ